MQGLVPYGDDDDVTTSVHTAEQSQQQARGDTPDGSLYKGPASLFNRGAGGAPAPQKSGQKAAVSWFPQNLSKPGGGGQQSGRQSPQQHSGAVDLQVLPRSPDPPAADVAPHDPARRVCGDMCVACM